MLRCMSCWSFSKRAWDSATTGSKKGSTAFSCEYANTALTCCVRNNQNVAQKLDCNSVGMIPIALSGVHGSSTPTAANSFLIGARRNHAAMLVILVNKLTKMTCFGPVKNESRCRRK